MWPVKFLLQLRFLDLKQVLVLESLYQILNVVCEIPSGVFSDRLGRRPTLIVAASCGAASAAVFGLGSGFWAFLAANALSAVSASFQSGTDRAFHYDALEAEGREGEFQAREAILHRDNLVVQSILCVAGGLLGIWSLRLPYAAAFACGAVALAAAGLMKEPPPKTQVAGQFGGALSALKAPVVAWAAAFSALAAVLDHFPYQYYQPYLQRLSWGSSTAIAAGLHVAAAHFVGAGAVALAPRLLGRFAPRKLLLASSWIHLGMMALAAAFLHPAVAVLLALRELPNALKNTLIAPMVLPSVGAGARATILSLIAFGSRLAVAAAIFGVSRVEGMSAQLWTATAACAAAWLVLSGVRPRERT